MIRLVTKHLTQIFIPFHSLLLKNTYEYKNHRKDIFKSKHVNIKIDKQKDKFQPNNLFHIFKYRKRAIEDFTQIRQYFIICREIAKYYKKQYAYEFQECKIQIQKLINNLTTLSFEDLTIENYFDILDFINVVIDSNKIKRKIINILKDLIFLNIQKYIINLDKLSSKNIMNLYSKLLPLYHPRQYEIGQYLLQSLIQQQYILTQQLINHIFIGIKYRKYPSEIDIKLIKIIFIKLQSENILLDYYVLSSIISSIYSISLTSLVSDQTSIQSINKLQNILNSHIINIQYQDIIIQNIISSFTPHHHHKSIIYDTILSKLIHKINNRQINNTVIKHLIKFIKYIHYFHYHSSIFKYILNYLQYTYSNQQYRKIVYQHIPLELFLLQLVRSTNIQPILSDINQLMLLHTFEAQWSLIATYSIQNYQFPLSKLLSKIKPKTCELHFDSIFVKMAVSIGIQYKRFKNEQLKKVYQKLTNEIKNIEWNRQSIQWLGRQLSLSRQYFKQFHNEYNKYYIQNLYNKIKESSDINQINIFNQYLISNFNIYNCQINLFNIINLQLLNNILIKQRNYQKYITPFLFFIIQYNLFKGIIHQKSKLYQQIIRIMVYYSNQQLYQNQDNWHLLLKIINSIINQYKKNKHTANINNILKKIIGCSIYIPYYHSSSMLHILTNILNSINKLEDQDLITLIIRVSLKRKMLNNSNMPSIIKYINLLSQQEQDQINNISNNNINKQIQQLSKQNINNINNLSNNKLQWFIFNYQSNHQQLYNQFISNYINNINQSNNDNPSTISFMQILQKVSPKIDGVLISKLVDAYFNNSRIQYHLLSDHYIILSLLQKRGIQTKYMTLISQYILNNYQKYKYNTNYRKILGILPHLNMHVNNSIINEIISDYSIQPNLQLKLISLYHTQLQSSYKDKHIQIKNDFNIMIKNRIKQIINNSIYEIQKNVYTIYLQYKFNIYFKRLKINKQQQFIFNRNFNQLELSFINIFKDNNISIKQQSTIFGNIIIIGSKIILFPGNHLSNTINNFIINYLQLKYQNMIFILSKQQKQQIHQLFIQIQSKKLFNDAIINLIKTIAYQ